MALGALFLLFLLLVGVPLLGAWPVARAFQTGLEAARNPENRTTPQSPWDFFRDAAWKRLRRWVVIWAVLAVIGSALVLLTTGSNPVRLYRVTIVILLFASPLAYFSAYCWLVAPRMKSLAALIITGSLLAIVLTVTIWILGSMLPGSFGSVVVKTESAMPGGGTMKATNIYPTGHFWSFASALLFHALARRSARRMGDAWFRFEE